MKLWLQFKKVLVGHFFLLGSQMTPLTRCDIQSKCLCCLALEFIPQFLLFDAVLYLAPMIPTGMKGILRNPQE
jgi:hypothetical protein